MATEQKMINMHQSELGHQLARMHSSIVKAPDLVRKLLNRDQVRVSISKTIQLAKENGPLSYYHFVAGYSFFILMYWINVSSTLIAEWTWDVTIIVVMAHLGGIFWGVIYDSQEGDCCGDAKLGVIIANLIFLFVGAIIWAIYFFINLYDRVDKGFFIYFIGFFFFFQMTGMMTLAMTSAADIMARNKNKGTKCARRMGSMIFMFGLGMMLGAVLYQAFNITTSYETQDDRDWAYRIQGMVCGWFYITAIIKLKGAWDALYHNAHHEIAHHRPPKHHDEHYAPRHHVEVDRHYEPSHHL